jgi:2-keto-4-pentenoate hydratase/2-oxohepta-3-ene-1,7-dioic acid hydratase in catechol pathway
MKIICIGRNYADHAKELNNSMPSEPVFFFKPDTSILPKKQPFYIPSFTNDLHHELEVVIRINKLGKNISEKFAHTYYDEIGLGIDFTARDIQQECKEKGLPWEKAKAFDYSAPLGAKFLNKRDIPNLNDISFKLLKNGVVAQEGNTKNMIFNFDKIISYISQFVTLKIGDLIFTGTPAGVSKVDIGDKLEGLIGEEKLLDLRVK